MQIFADLFALFLENLHFIAISFVIIALTICFVILSIELKARYYLSIKKRMIELESKQIKK